MKNYPQKRLALLLACLLTFTLCACSAWQNTAANDTAAEGGAPIEAETTADSAENDETAPQPEDAGEAAPETEADANEDQADNSEAETYPYSEGPQEGNTAANAGSGETQPPQGPVSESVQAEAPQAPAEESVPVEEPVQTAPAEEPVSSDTVQTETSQVNNAPAPEAGGEDLKAIAEGLVGRPVSELYAAIGSPISSSYAPSCLVVDGEDGELIYDGFVVYTEKGPDYETVYAVF